MEGGRGHTWAAFEENAKEHESLTGWHSHNRNPISPTAGRLCREDMAIYGEEPALDSLSLVICKQCGRVVKSQALLKHNEQHHCAKMMNVPAPHSIHPPHNPFTIGQPSSSAPNASTTNPSFSSSGPRGEDSGVMGFTATNLPSTATPATGGGGGGGSGSGTSRSVKEYDPNRHCGVWIEDERRYCTHSLTCKLHPVSERRKVQGRSQPFDKLLEEHRKKKRMKRMEKLNKEASVHISGYQSRSSPLRSPTYPRYDPSPPLVNSTSAAPNITSPRSGPRSPPFPPWDDNDAEEFPKPLAVSDVNRLLTATS